MALSRGAHVIATVRGDADEARRLGAQEVYDTKAVDVIYALRVSHPEGFDAVLDLVNASDVIHRDAEILKPGGRLVSTIYAAERHITAHNISSSAAESTAKMTANPKSSSQGLAEVAGMLANSTITTRIGSTFDLNGTDQMLEKLRNGGLRGKTVVRL